MAWDVDLPIILRALVNDLDTPQTFSDDKLLQVLVVGAFQVLQGLNFSQTFRVSISNVTLTPDPTVDPTVDDSFTNLVTLRSASIIDYGSAITAASRAIAVRDGSSSVDLRAVFKSKLALLEKGWTAVYEDARLEYQAGLVRQAGAAVMSPFRLFATNGFYTQVPGRDRDNFIY